MGKRFLKDPQNKFTAQLKKAIGQLALVFTIGIGALSVNPMQAWATVNFVEPNGTKLTNGTSNGFDSSKNADLYTATVPCGTVVTYTGPNLIFTGDNNRTLKHSESGVVLYHSTEKVREDADREYFYTTVYITASWGSWTRTVNPTCTSTGKETRTCSGCGATETRSVAALGHSYSSTWSSNGSQHWKACTRSGCTAKTSTANHTYGAYYDNTATCTSGGTRKRKCSTCGYVETTSSTALGHASPSSYTQNGGYLYKYCTRCNAQLEKKGISYSIKFDGNEATSGSMTGQAFIYGTAQTLSPNLYVRQNYEFLGWATTNNATEPTYTDQQSVNNLTTTNNETITLYAIWKLSTTNIVFHDNGGHDGQGTVTWTVGSMQHPISPIKEGYNFAGWNTKEDGSGSIWPLNDCVPANVSDYYAQWIPVMYTVVEEPNFSITN